MPSTELRTAGLLAYPACDGHPISINFLNIHAYIAHSRLFRRPLALHENSLPGLRRQPKHIDKGAIRIIHVHGALLKQLPTFNVQPAMSTPPTPSKTAPSCPRSSRLDPCVASPSVSWGPRRDRQARVRARRLQQPIREVFDSGALHRTQAPPLDRLILVPALQQHPLRDPHGPALAYIVVVLLRGRG